MIPTSKRAKMAALPVGKEQLQLNQAQSLVKSNLISLQINEMLNEVDIERITKKKKLVEWQQSFMDALSRISSDQTTDLSWSWLQTKQMKCLNLNQYQIDTAAHFETKSPTVELIGSYRSESSTFPYVNIDIALLLPIEMFESRDLYYYSYHHKRALYVAFVADLLMTDPDISSLVKEGSVHLSSFKGDALKPIIVLQPSVTTASCEIIVTIVPTLSAHKFKVAHLRTGRCNTAKADSHIPVALAPPAHGKLVKGSKNSATEKQKLSSESSGAGQVVGGSGEASVSAARIQEQGYPSSVVYNMSIAEDLSVLLHHRLLKNTFETFAVAKSATLLLKVWVTQRGLRFAPDSLDGHSCALLVAYLLQTKRISATASPLAAFQATIDFLARSELPLSIDFRSAEIKSREHVDALAEAQGHPNLFPVSLTHPIVGQSDRDIIDYNCFWRISKSSWLQLKDEATNTQLLLQRSSETCFRDIFMQKKPFFQRYDLYFHLPVAVIPSAGSYGRNVSDGVEATGDELRDAARVSACVKVLLDKALIPGDRVTALHTFVCTSYDNAIEPRGDTAGAGAGAGAGAATKAGAKTAVLSPSASASTPSSSSQFTSSEKHLRQRFPSAHPYAWSLHEPLSTARPIQSSVAIGLVLNKDRAHRKVDKASESSAFATAEEFQQFWGEKSQLRRFKDGTIVDAVVWEAEAVEGKKAELASGVEVVEWILRYTLGRHLPELAGVTGQRVHSLQATLERGSPLVALATRGDLGGRLRSEDVMRGAIQALDHLRTIMTSTIKGLPLTIDGLMGVSPALRYTSLFPPVPHPFIVGDRSALRPYAGRSLSLLVEPLVVIATLSSSSKWPTDPDAVQKSISAYILMLSDLLRVQFQVRSIGHRGYLDVHYEGFLFRVKIDINRGGEPTPSAASLLTTGEGEEGMDVPETNKTGGARAVGGGNGSGSDKGRDEESRQVGVDFDLSTALKPSLLHHKLIGSVQATLPSYAQSVRLLLLWLSGHRFTGVLSQRVVELLVASVYLSPDRMHQPSSAVAGLMQALKRLADWDWMESALIVDFANDLSATQRRSIDSFYQVFKQQRRGLGRMTVVAAYNSASIAFPDEDVDMPENAILSMLRTHASKTCQDYLKLVETVPDTKSVAAVMGTSMLKVGGSMSGVKGEKVRVGIDGSGSVSGATEASPAVDAFATLMRSDALLPLFNIVLVFSKSIVTARDDPMGGPPFASFRVFANLSDRECDYRKLIVGEHPYPSIVQAQIVERLRDKFGEIALFFWDGYAGDEVGVVWKPKYFTSQAFSILGMKHTLPVSFPSSAPAEGGGAGRSKVGTAARTVAGAGEAGSRGCLVIRNVTEIVSEMLAECEGTVGEVKFK